MKKMMKRMMKAATCLLLLAAILCLSCVNALATTVANAGGDSLDDHLILYTSFDAESTVDDSDNGHDGTPYGNVQYADGISGKALHITGADSAATKIYVNYGDSSAIIPDYADFSFSVFYRSLGETADWSTILGNKDYSSGANTGFALAAKDDNGGARLNATSRKNILCSDQSVYDGNWHQLAASFDRDGNMVLYVDGLSVGSVDISSIASTSMNAGLPLMLGTDGNNNNFLLNNCMLDELRIYDKALTEVAAP